MERLDLRASLMAHLDAVRAARARGVAEALRWTEGGLGARGLVFCRGIGAVAAVERLSKIPVRDQVHPVTQALIRETLERVGAMTALLPELLSEAAERGDPSHAQPALDHLRDVLGVAGGGPLRPDGSGAGAARGEAFLRLNRNGLRALEEEIGDEGIAPRLRRAARRLRRLSGLAERIAAAGGDTGALTPADPSIAAAVAEGEATRVGEVVASEVGAQAGSEANGGRTALQILGLIACGLGVLVGGYLLIAGVVCAISCAAAETLLISLLGAALIVVSVVGIRRILRSRSPTSLEGSPGGALPEPQAPAE